MKKIILIGPCGGGGIPKNGASAKNFHLVNYLKTKQLRVVNIDTENWKRNPMVFLRLLVYVLFFPKAVFILAANSMSSYRVIQFFSVLPVKRHLIYWTIGGCVANWIKEGKVKRKPYNAVKMFLVEGRKMQQVLAECGFRNARYVPNFKNIDFIPAQRDYEDGMMRFVFLSRLIPEKGCNIILDAVRLLNEKYEDRFCVDFYGPFEQSYEREFEEKSRDLANVSYKGFLNLSKSENYNILADYDIMLFPTYWEGEGFPGIVIDAFVAGLPVIASDWSLNADIIKHGKTGVILKDNTAKELHDAMLSFIEGREDLNAMKANCRHEATEYDIHNVLSDKFLKEYTII